MLIDITHAVGGYLHDVFVGNMDWGILIGYVAQIMFAMRFVVQWIASERAGRSVVPTAPSIASARAASSGVTPGAAYIPVQPAPTSAGVLGIARTSRA